MHSYESICFAFSVLSSWGRSINTIMKGYVQIFFPHDVDEGPLLVVILMMEAWSVLEATCARS